MTAEIQAGEAGCTRDSERAVVPIKRCAGTQANSPGEADVFRPSPSVNALLQKYDAVVAVLDQIAVGLLIVTPDGNVVLANREALKLLRCGEGIALSRDNRLVCRRGSKSGAIADAIRKVSQTACGPGQHSAVLIQIPRCGEKCRLLIEVRPLSTGDARLEGHGGGAMIVMLDPERQSALNSGTIRAAFNLSEAEEEVCKLMMRGLSTDEIACKRGVRPDTVKSQIKSIYAKADVSNRTGLIRLVLSICPPLTDSG